MLAASEEDMLEFREVEFFESVYVFQKSGKLHCLPILYIIIDIGDYAPICLHIDLCGMSYNALKVDDNTF